MKIRISGNTLRLRLSSLEVDDLIQNGYVASSCQIGPNALQYILKQEVCEAIYATLNEQTITVFIPQYLCKDWHVDERIGFESPANQDLYILIEKDFKCMMPRPNEDETSLYENPQAHKEHP